jgi:hypothetical protein
MTETYDPPLERAARRTGSLVVIAGSVLAGKTEELIRRALYARRSVQVFEQAGAEEGYEVPEGVFRYVLPGL